MPTLIYCQRRHSSQKARARFSKPIPAASHETVNWYCGSCGKGFSLDDVLLDDSLEDQVPFCPRCPESGWETVRPQVNE